MRLSQPAQRFAHLCEGHPDSPGLKVSRLCRAASTTTGRSPEALEGVDVMLLAGRDSPDSVSQHQRVLAHARRAEVRHIVKLSAIGASPSLQ